MPTQAAWLVKSTANIARTGDKNQLNVDIVLNKGDRKPVALSNVEVKIYEGRYYLFKEEMRTGIDGSLRFSQLLKDKVDTRSLRVQITGLEKEDQRVNRVVQIPLTITRDEKIDLQFLPEGGNLIAGIPTVVGFKAIGEDGKGIDVNGVIYDSKGNKQADFKSLYKGIGSFKFTAVANETYVAKLNNRTSATKTFPLPQISLLGISLHVDNPKDATDIKIELKGLKQLRTDSNCYLVATNGGKISYSEEVKLDQPVISISKNIFPSGITRFTLLQGKRPLNERMIFIDNPDRLTFSLTPNKPVYQKRDSVSIDIEVKDQSGMPVQGSFSLAVTDNSQVKLDTLNNFSIATNLLLRSELKGNIETPGYYLTRKDSTAWQALDNLMLTQGWTGYDWKDVFGPAPAPKFVMEKEFNITGKVVNLSNKPIPNAPVILSSQKPNFLTMGFTDKDGVFAFKNIPQLDSGSYFIQAKNKKGNSLTFGAISVDKFKAPYVPEMYRSPILPWYVNSDTAQLGYVTRFTQKQTYNDPKIEGTLLRNVNIKKVKVIPDGLNGRTDLAFDVQDIRESTTPTLYQLLKQKIPGFQIVNDYANHHGAVVIKILGSRRIGGVDVPSEYFVDIGLLNIDNKLLPWYYGRPPFGIEDYKEMLSNFLIPDLKSLEIAWSGNFIGQINPNYYIAMIYVQTFSGAWANYSKINRKPGEATLRPLPLYAAQQFYRPKYPVNAVPTSEPDYRSTIHWEPQLYTDINGKARVTFFTSDLPKNYSINIQGMTPDGELGSLVSKFPIAQPTAKLAATQ